MLYLVKISNSSLSLPQCVSLTKRVLIWISILLSLGSFPGTVLLAADAVKSGLPADKSANTSGTGSNQSVQDEQKKLQSRIQQLEQSNQELQNSLQEIKDSLSQLQPPEVPTEEFERSFRMYGFMQPGYHYLRASHPKLNVLHDFPSYDLGPLNIYFDAQFQKNWRALLEISIDGAPRSERATADNSYLRFADREDVIRVESNGIRIERALLSYLIDPKLELKIGTFILPHGIYRVDHASYVLPTIRIPNITAFPDRMTGVMASGDLDSSRLIFHYDLYIANGPGIELDPNIDRKRAVGIERDVDYDKAYGYKGKLSLKTWGIVQQAFLGYGVYKGLRTTRNSLSPDLNSGIKEEIYQQRYGSEMLLKLEYGQWQFEVQGEVVNVVDAGYKVSGDPSTENSPTLTANRNIYSEYYYTGIRWNRIAVYFEAEEFISRFDPVHLKTNGLRIHINGSTVLKMERSLAHGTTKALRPFVDLVADQIILAVGF